jgi:hypothetical protein
VRWDQNLYTPYRTYPVIMADSTRDIDIGSYLKSGRDRTHAPVFVIFPDWSSQDWENACSRIQNALNNAGLSLTGRLPQMVSTKATAAPDEKRVAAEKLLFGRYNQDSLFSLPHQKDPSVPRPSWFRDSMLVPGPYSIGQKPITIARHRASNAASKAASNAATRRAKEAEQHHRRSDQVHRRSSSEAATENAPSAQATPDRTDEETVTPEEESLPADSEFKATQTIPKSGELKDLEIHIGTIFELDTGLLKLRRTYRNPSSWLDDSALERFNFVKVCQSLGITSGWEKELYLFPDVTKGPHNILDKDELDGAVQLLRKQNSKNAMESGISLFVAADASHVCALPLEKRGKHSKIRFDHVFVHTNDVS